MQAMANGAAVARIGDTSSNQATTKSQFTGSAFQLLRLVLAMLLSCYAADCCAQGSAFAATSTPIATPGLPTINKEVQEVGVLLTVTNWFGHFVKNLNEQDLHILDNGQPVQKITYFQSQTNLPLRVGIVIDSSASITTRFKFELRSAKAFLRRVLRPATDTALVVAFNQDIELHEAVAPGMESLTSRVSKLSPGGETAIYDAVSFTCKELAKGPGAQPSRRALVLITDGDDNRSYTSLQQAIESALRSDTIIYVLSTNPEYSLSLREQGELAMKKLAEATGGRLLRADSSDDVNRAFSNIDRELRSQYAIGYKPPVGRPDGLFHRLVVLGPKRLHIYHRQGYFATR
jgi:VWFA-related protein